MKEINYDTYEVMVDEVAASCYREMMNIAKRLFESGAIDTSKYRADEYMLARLLVAAALKKSTFNMLGSNKQLKDDLKNLSAF